MNAKSLLISIVLICVINLSITYAELMMNIEIVSHLISSNTFFIGNILVFLVSNIMMFVYFKKYKNDNNEVVLFILFSLLFIPILFLDFLNIIVQFH